MITELIKANTTGLMVVGVFIILDIITGFIRAILENNVSSKKMREGMLHKIMELIVIVVSYCLDILIGGATVSTATIMFLVGMEGISILENIGPYVPLPEVIKSVLELLKSKGDVDESKN